MALEETRVVATDVRDNAELDAWLFAGMFLVRFVDNNLAPIILAVLDDVVRVTVAFVDRWYIYNRLRRSARRGYDWRFMQSSSQTNFDVLMLWIF